MKKIAKYIIPGLFCAALLAGCVRHEEPGVPDGDKVVAVTLSFVTQPAEQVVSRSNLNALMSRIDDVHVLIFGDGPDGLPNTDDDPVVVRNYIQYNVEQKVYLRTDSTYRIFAAANLDSFGSITGDAAHYFDDVYTYGDLKNKFVTQGPTLVPDKLIMTTNGLITVTLPYPGPEPTMRIPLIRLHSQLELNIYNKVTSSSNTTITSGIYPVAFTAINVPVYSYLLAGPVDYSSNFSSDPASAYTQTQTYTLPAPEATLVYRNNNWYTKQTVYGYNFENRQGSVPGITDVYQRKKLAPPFATIGQITSNTANNVLLTYILPGKGRGAEPNDPDVDIFNNFDIDRNCIYHINVYFNGVADVLIDTRQEYLDQLVVFSMPDTRRVDAHYMDIPASLRGNNGMVKLQSGVCDVDANGEIIYNDPLTKKSPRNLRLMEDSDLDSVRWLRFSDHDPYRPHASTVKYAKLTDPTIALPVIMHLNEYTAFIDKDTQLVPPRRTAVIRIGYVSGATDKATYEAGADLDNESFFFRSISQWGMRSIGQVGGFDSVSISYTSLLGVESAEEYRFGYYDNQVTNAGPTWNYPGQVSDPSLNLSYFGLKATMSRYDVWRATFPGGVPPKRDDPGTTYDPVYNTFAADYCMRKNRDEDGNGIIEGDEIKWYMPTPVQLMQISLWRSTFNYSFNLTYNPFTTPYWTTNESDADNALALDFAAQQAGVFTSEVSPFLKETRYPVRCVRDIPGKVARMIYISTVGGNSYLAGNLTGQMPSGIMADKTGWEESQIISMAGNEKMQTSLIISRYYVRSGTTITMGDGGGTPCSTYSEPGQTSGWRLPTQRELSFLYAYSHMIDNALNRKFDGAYDGFIRGFHWASTCNDNAAHFWGVNFLTGVSQMEHKGKLPGYFRCVKYISTPLTPDPIQ